MEGATTRSAELEQAAASEHLEEIDEEQVSALELFFDLVFVFAFTQVTGLMAANPTWQGLGQGMLVLAAVWWSWGGYAWLTNSLHSDDGIARVGLLGAMAAMLIAALAVPGAFGDSAAVFGVAYLAVRVIHIAVYGYGAPEADNRAAILGLAPGLLLAPAILLVGCLVGGTAEPILWVVALVIDYGTPYVRDVSGFRVSASHFHERFGLIIIIALGESIVATGAGLRETGLTAGVVAAAVAGLAIAGAQWWAYFDVVALVAGRRFAELDGAARAKLARDSYGVLHLLLIAGIVLVALGLEKTLLHVDEPLDTVPAFALCGGAAVYLAGHILFRLRNVRSLNRQRLLVAMILVALIPFATAVDALVAVIVVALVHVALIGYEATRFRDARSRVRHEGAASLREQPNATG